MTTNAGLDALGLDEPQKRLFWNFLAIVKVMKEKANMPGTTTWTANNVINFMEGLD